MKKSLLSLALFALTAAGTASASTATTATSPAPQDLFRYDISCTFSRPGFNCEAMSRILLDRSRADAANPQWFGNLLSIACQQVTSPPSPLSLISASDATLYRVTGEDGVRYEIYNSDGTVDIDLTDHPFQDHPTTVNARLEIQNGGHLDGSCALIPTDVHH